MRRLRVPGVRVALVPADRAGRRDLLGVEALGDRTVGDEGPHQGLLTLPQTHVQTFLADAVIGAQRAAAAIASSSSKSSAAGG